MSLGEDLQNNEKQIKIDKWSILRSVISILAGLGIILFFILNLDVSTIADKLKNAHIFWVIFAICIHMLAFLIRGYRWGVLLAPAHPSEKKYANLFVIALSGWALNAAFPGRVGDFARAYYLRTHEKVPISIGFASLFLEKVYDVAVMVLISVFLFLFVIDKSLLPKEMFHGLVIVILFISFIVLCLILMMAFPNLGKRISDLIGKTIDCTISKILPKIGNKLKSKLEGFIEMLINSTVQISKDKECILLSTIMTILIWVLEAERATCILISFDMKAELSLIIFVFTFGTLLGLILPILPGNLGVLEFVLSTLIMVMLSMSKETSWAIVLVDRFVSFWFITMIGGLAIFLLSRAKDKDDRLKNEDELKEKVSVTIGK